jgi:hypothetical protein
MYEYGQPYIFVSSLGATGTGKKRKNKHKKRGKHISNTSKATKDLSSELMGATGFASKQRKEKGKEAINGKHKSATMQAGT